MDPIYLDHAATTPVRPEVAAAMCQALEELPGNPSSQHAWGRTSRMRLEEARERLAAVLGAARREVYFTSGGTVADNLAVLGRWRAARRGVAAGAGGAVVYSAVEHKAVIGAAEAAAREGAERVVLAVDGDGRVQPESLDDAVPAEPVVLSVMWGNNEVGTLQPVAELAARCREAGIAFHTDAVQAFGKVPVRVDRVPVDLLTVTAHKIGGPKGIGALYVRDGVAVEPLVHGGGQERGLHPGTENVAGAIAFALAAELAEREREAEAARLAGLRDRLQAQLVERVDGLIVNAGGAARLPHILNVSLPEVDQEALLVSLDLEGVAASSGSACQSGTVEPSHVLVAMGRGSADEASIRLSVGRGTTAEMVDEAAERFVRVVERVRSAAFGA
ncbi:MAG TPA: cysteine desulfurase family protein [Longimicrobiales bacterium]